MSIRNFEIMLSKRTHDVSEYTHKHTLTYIHTHYELSRKLVIQSHTIELGYLLR